MDVMKQLGSELVPYIRQYENEVHPSFDKLPISYLPPGFNRNFLAASELLTSMKSEPDNLGGCVLFNGSILCTHLEPETSSYILTKVESMTKVQGQGDICLPVFVRNDELERLRDGRTPAIVISEEAKSHLPDVLSPSSTLLVDTMGTDFFSTPFYFSSFGPISENL